MKKVKGLISILICLAMVLSTTVFAAIPSETDNGVSLPNWATLSSSKTMGNGNGGAGGSYKTVDTELGTAYRWTSNSGTQAYNRFYVSLYFRDDKSQSTGINNGDKFYVSFYYRINTAATDANVTGTPTNLAMAEHFHSYIDSGAVDVWKGDSTDCGVWKRYEGIIDISFDRDWWESALHFSLNGLASGVVVSLDMANIKVAHLGAATDEEGATILQQVQNTFSSNSNVTSITLDGNEIYEEGVYEYEVTGDADEIIAGLKVTPEDSGAFVKTIKEDENTIRVVVYSSKADITEAYPSTSVATEFIILCGEATATIPANDGKGIRFEADNTYDTEGVSARSYYMDGDLGKILRYSFNYEENTATKWPKFNLAFKSDETVSAKAGDLIYFSYYWRANTPEIDSNVDADTSIKYLNLSPYANEFSGTTITLGHTGQSTMNPGEWHKAEYIIPIKADKELDVFTTNFQHGSQIDLTGSMSMDFANPECYYLGAATYTGGESGKEAALIAKLKETFSDSTLLSELSVCGNSVDLAVNTDKYIVKGSAAKVLNSLQYAAKETGALTAVKKTADDEVVITVYSHLEDDVTAADAVKSTYTIKNDVLIKPVALKKDGAVVESLDSYAAGAYSVDLKIQNSSAAAFAGTALLAAYNKDKELLDAKIVDISMEENAAESTKSVSVSADEDIEYFRLYVWNGMEPELTVTNINKNGIIE